MPATPTPRRPAPPTRHRLLQSRIAALALAAATLFTLAAAGPAAARPHRRGGDRIGAEDVARQAERRLERLASALDLTDAQKERAESIYAGLGDELRTTFEQLRGLREEIDRLLAAEPADATAVGEAVLRAEALRDDIATAREAAEAELATLLTPEQAERLAALKSAFGDRGRRGGPGRHHGGRRGFGPRG